MIDFLMVFLRRLLSPIRTARDFLVVCSMMAGMPFVYVFCFGLIFMAGSLALLATQNSH